MDFSLFFLYTPVNFCSSLYYFLLFTCTSFYLVSSSLFSNFLSGKLGNLFQLSSYLVSAFAALNYHLSTVFATCYKFLFVVFLFFINTEPLSNSPCDFSFDWLFSSVLFSFHVFVTFPSFLLLLISNSILLWLEKKYIVCFKSFHFY